MNIKNAQAALDKWPKKLKTKYSVGKTIHLPSYLFFPPTTNALPLESVKDPWPALSDKCQPPVTSTSFQRTNISEPKEVEDEDSSGLRFFFGDEA